jgi:mannitol-1-/sugar-/sorbitol-6-phosphatase
VDPDTEWTTVSARNLLEYLIAHRPNDSPSVIGIDGRSRSGKSTLADVIAQCIERVAVVHTDDIAWHQSFFGWSEILIDGVLRPLRRQGGPVSFTPQTWMERGRPGSIEIPADARVVLIEGVGATRAELGRWLDATIWVHADSDVALDRTMALDRDPPGFVEEWMREENAHLAADQPWTRATALVSGEHPFSVDAIHVRFPAMTPPPSSAGVRFGVAGILFDNDGVLVDSHDVAATVWNQWATTWAPGFDFHRDVPHGLRLRDAVARIVRSQDVVAAAQELIEMESTLATQVPAVPGAAELAAQCPPGSWAVVTSGLRTVAVARLTSAQIPHPTVVISADDVPHGKPSPDPYLAGSAALGLPPGLCAVFEDAAAGIASARAAGVARVIGVGETTLGQDVDVAVTDLRGISFDGTQLIIPYDIIIQTTSHRSNSTQSET